MKILLLIGLISNNEVSYGNEPSFTGPVSIFLGLVAFVVMIILPSYWVWKGIWANYPPFLRSRYKIWLKEVPFYNSLQVQQKKSFERKVQRFINQKQFIPRDGLQIDDRKKMLIAATAIELTHGFKRFDFAHFDRILLYSNDYYSKISKQYHRGEVNLKGFIVLSWAAFEEGNANRRDGINLGIHELAHALKLENKILNRNYRFISKEDYRSFLQQFEAFSKGPRSKSDFLRSYARTNIHEFFAVCCENFIERPLEFEREMPALYDLLCKILRMNPLRL